MAETTEGNRLRDLVLNDIKSTAKGRADLKQKIETRKKMTDNELPNRQYFGGRANVRVPFPYMYAQSMIPRHMSATFSGQNILDCIPLDQIAYICRANTRKLLNFQLLFEMDFFIQALVYYTSLCNSGAAVQKMRWNDEKQTGELHFIRPDLFCMDPRYPFMCHQTAWAAHQVGKTKQEMLDAIASKGWDPDVVADITKGDAPTTTPDGTQVAKERGVYPLWEWWGKADPDGKGLRNIITWVGSDKLLGYVDSPYGDQIPFIALSDVPDAQNFYSGKSELDSIQSLYEASSDILNQRLDNVTMNINGFWTYRKNSGLNLNQLVSSPWGILGVSSHDDLKRWESKDVTNDAYKEIPSLVELMKMSTGFQDVLQGNSTPGEKTYGEVGVLRNEAGQRPGLKLQMGQHLYVSRVGELLLKQDQMFMSKDKAVTIIGDELGAIEVLSPESINGRYRVTPRANSLISNKEARMGQLVNFMNVMRGIPGREQDITDAAEEFRALADIKRQPQSQVATDAMRQQAVGQFSSALQPSQAGQGNPPGVPSQAGVPPAGAAKPPVTQTATPAMPPAPAQAR